MSPPLEPSNTAVSPTRPSIQHQGIVETSSRTTRKHSQQQFVTQILVGNSRVIRCRNNHAIPDYRISYIPRVVCQDERQYGWHECNVAFDAKYLKFREPDTDSVTVHLGVSLIDRDKNRRFSTDKWIHHEYRQFDATRKSDLMKVRCFVSDRVLLDGANRLLSNDGQLTIEANLSVYESRECFVGDKRYDREWVLEHLRRSFGRDRLVIAVARLLDASLVTRHKADSTFLRPSVPMPFVSFDALNLLSNYFYDVIGGGGGGDVQKKWETDLLVFIAKYGVHWTRKIFGNINAQQIVNENVLKLLYYSSLCAGLNRLHQFCVQFVIDHASETVFVDYWKDLPSELLILMFSLLATSKHQHNSLGDRKKFNREQKAYQNLSLKVSNRIEETFSYTRPSKYHILHDWTIDNFINKLLLPDCQLVSPKFCALEKSCLQFRIVKSSSHLKENIFTFDLVLKHELLKDCSDKEDLIIRYNVSFHKVTSRDYSRSLAIGSSYTHLANDLYMRNSAALLEYYYGNLHETNQFNISCDVTLLCDIVAYDLTKTTPVLSQLVEQSRNHLRDCINSLLHDDKRNGDVTLVMRGFELKVHSVFLAQSPVIKALVAQSNLISIPGLSIEAFESLMQYLYTGKVQSLDKYVKELLIVASRYELKLLEQMCQHAMNQCSSLSNANDKSRFRE